MSNPRTRVLFAEDDADTRELVAYVLTQNNCEIVTTGSYDGALLLAKTDSFDLYILDNWLTDKSGMDLCLRLREIDPKTPILFYSGATLEEDRQRALSCGAQVYLTKPANNDELVSAVLRLTGGSGVLPRRSPGCSWNCGIANNVRL
jgi:DNA-binding response OmpR family regulator